MFYFNNDNSNHIINHNYNISFLFNYLKMNFCQNSSIYLLIHQEDLKNMKKDKKN
jgi:hypothetical protein